MEEESLGLNALEELRKEHQEVLSQLDTLEVAIVELAKEQCTPVDLGELVDLGEEWR